MVKFLSPDTARKSGKSTKNAVNAPRENNDADLKSEKNERSISPNVVIIIGPGTDPGCEAGEPPVITPAAKAKHKATKPKSSKKAAKEKKVKKVEAYIPAEKKNTPHQLMTEFPDKQPSDILRTVNNLKNMGTCALKVMNGNEGEKHNGVEAKKSAAKKTKAEKAAKKAAAKKSKKDKTSTEKPDSDEEAAAEPKPDITLMLFYKR